MCTQSAEKPNILLCQMFHYTPQRLPCHWGRSDGTDHGQVSLTSNNLAQILDCIGAKGAYQT